MPKHFVRAKCYDYVLKNKLEKAMRQQIKVYDGLLVPSTKDKDTMLHEIEHKLEKLHKLYPRCKKIYNYLENNTLRIPRIGHVSFYEVKKEVGYV